MGLHSRTFSIALAALLVLWLGACTNSDPLDSPSAEAPPTDPEASVELTEVPAALGDLPTLNGMATVEMVVNGSSILIEVDGENAPITAGNFVDLVDRGVYDNLVFHRVVREPEPFVVQGGDPQSNDPDVPAQQWGTGGFIDPDSGARRFIPLEITPQGADEPIYSQTLDEAQVAAAPELPHSRGAVAMARSQAVDSASSQFYVTLADLPFLDGSYAVFGYVTEGMDVVDAIQQGDRIESARVVEGLDNLQR
ncbi:peptidylprolyl isomerase [Nodosilinea sp. P-1105]|uniref:peptidylprolyl isomerase n=1 Tax=Nodosilinea sp. P-1105 TaxID=2546229 RepID=UPI00146F652C|nr:peptidylprolyl isomerase [Nodosilinea sp. P-1105]NMF85348.1 peptidylprolyl isomerase [Nodosilinea sp. P-1105]